VKKGVYLVKNGSYMLHIGFQTVKIGKNRENTVDDLKMSSEIFGVNMEIFP